MASELTVTHLAKTKQLTLTELRDFIKDAVAAGATGDEVVKVNVDLRSHVKKIAVDIHRDEIETEET